MWTQTIFKCNRKKIHTKSGTYPSNGRRNLSEINIPSEGSSLCLSFADNILSQELSNGGRLRRSIYFVNCKTDLENRHGL